MRWKPLPGYYKPILYYYEDKSKDKEYLFEVSDTGLIRSNRYKESYIIPTYINTSGYSYFQFNILGKRITLTVHRAIMLAFVGDRPSNKEINHIDGRKQNNALDNLEYVTKSENMQHAFRIGLKKPLRGKDCHLYGKIGKNHPKSTPVEQFSLDGKLIKVWGSMNMVETQTDRKWKRTHISRSIKEGKQAYGFIWKKQNFTFNNK